MIPPRPRRTVAFLIPCATFAAALSACGDDASLPKNADHGPKPTIAAPKPSLIPTVNVAPAQGWAEGAKPVAAAGLEVRAYARGLDHPRTLLKLPNGDILVAETNAPVRTAENPGIRNWAMKALKARAGAGVPSANRITLLRGVNADGSAKEKHAFVTGLNSPFGMALIENTFYVANTDALVKFDYQEGQTSLTSPAVKVTDLPAGDLNHHWTKDLAASPDGSKLYVSVGSNSNVGENGLENEENRAAVLEVDPATGAKRLFAAGLRNPNGLTFHPETRELWAVVNERDELGSDLVPDYMTSIKAGGFYGWPYSYYGTHVDTRVPPAPDMVAKAIVPDYALGAHTASLGLTFYTGTALPERYRNGAFIGQHGSWNRRPFSGYKVIFVPFANGKPSGEPQDILTGFITPDGRASGRPVGVTSDQSGALLVADDVGNVVWRVTTSTAQSAR